jgi:hypothetical protein
MQGPIDTYLSPCTPRSQIRTLRLGLVSAFRPKQKLSLSLLLLRLLLVQRRQQCSSLFSQRFALLHQHTRRCAKHLQREVVLRILEAQPKMHLAQPTLHAIINRRAAVQKIIRLFLFFHPPIACAQKKSVRSSLNERLHSPTFFHLWLQPQDFLAATPPQVIHPLFTAADPNIGSIAWVCSAFPIQAVWAALQTPKIPCCTSPGLC